MYGKRCKWKILYEIVNYSAHFVTTNFYHGIAGMVCKDLKKKKEHILNTKKKIAEKEENVFEAMIYDVLQLVVKLKSNSIHGIMLLLDSITEGTTTYLARDYQNEVASKFLKLHYGPICMADTDSLAPISEKSKFNKKNLWRLFCVGNLKKKY